MYIILNTNKHFLEYKNYRRICNICKKNCLIFLFQIPNNNLNLTIALVSDVHIDPLYDPSSTSNCNEPACCRSSSTKYDLNNDLHQSKVFEKSIQRQFESKISNNFDNNNPFKRTTSHTNQAGYWGGDVKCDTPIWAYEDAVQRIASHKVSYMISLYSH